MRSPWTWIILALVLVPAATALADPIDELNPLTVLESGADVLPGGERDLKSSLELVLLLTVIGLAPSLLILCTCFTRIVIVLSLLRQALGTQSLPPNQVIVGLSLFLTAVVMMPTLERSYVEGVQPYVAGDITDAEEAWRLTRQPLRDFMFAQIEAAGNWSAVYMMLEYRGVDTSRPGELTRADVDMLSLVPAYILSELKVAFLMGFRLYLPFLVIDLVISSMLVSMGMLMLPPVMIALPFKLLLFVLVDGWQLVVGSLLAGIVQPEVALPLAAVVAGGGP